MNADNFVMRLFCKILMYSFLLLLSRFTFADKVDTSVAASVGKAFFIERLHAAKPAYDDQVYITESFEITDAGTPLIYVFNFSCGGFVLVSADNNAFPILGYSFEGKYIPGDIPENCQLWLSSLSDEIKYIIDHNVSATTEITTAWVLLKAGNYHFPEEKDTKSVQPLLTTKWGQGQYYNEMCPIASGGPGGHAYAGCVAIAVAQVLNYYKFPLTGIGTEVYVCNDGTYNLMCFDSCYYYWLQMKDTLTQTNNAVAELIYDCGVASNTFYSASGSYASFYYSKEGLQNHLKYFDGSEYVLKVNYTDTGWVQLLKSNLDEKKPVLYNGEDAAHNVAHAFVCDGYQGNDFFHFNWGWNGSCNGYYYVQNLNPSYDFSFDQTALINVYPDTVNYPYTCPDIGILTDDNGIFDDGSGNTRNYSDNKSCKWRIIKNNQNVRIRLEFLSFDTETGNDKLFIYDGQDSNSPLIAELSGTSMPPPISSSGNSIFLQFLTNDTINMPGWVIKYSVIYPFDIKDTTFYLYENTDTFSDGSGDYYYFNNMNTKWIINPSDVNYISLTLSSLNIEDGKDFIYIYDLSYTSPMLVKTITGTSNLLKYEWNSNKIMLNFITNYEKPHPGWDASYTSGYRFDKDIGLYNFICYPDPVIDELNIHFEFALKKDATIKISNILGYPYYSEELYHFAGNCDRNIDVSEYGKGVYIVQLITDGEVLECKFEKM